MSNKGIQTDKTLSPREQKFLTKYRRNEDFHASVRNIRTVKSLLRKGYICAEENIAIRIEILDRLEHDVRTNNRIFLILLSIYVVFVSSLLIYSFR